MTTAARPTFDAARGGTQKAEGNLSVLSKQYSSRDLPSHTKIKTRQTGQNTADEIRGRDFKRDLLERERSVREKSKSSRSSSETSSLKRARIETSHSAAALDADDPVDDDDDDNDSDESDDEDDTAELLAELQRIKRDRAEEIMKREQEKRVEEERIRTEHLLSGNPLLNQQESGDFKVNRRWDDDVVFKNCAKDDDKPSNKGFVNDTIRSEFHKRFMDKYIK